MSVLVWILWKLAWAVAAIAALFFVYVSAERKAQGQRKIANLLLLTLVVALALWALVHPGWGSLGALYAFPLGILWWATVPATAIWTTRSRRLPNMASTPSASSCVTVTGTKTATAPSTT